MFTWICHRWFFGWQTSRVLSKLLHNVDRFILHFIRHVRVSIVIEILLCPSRSGNSFILAPFSRRVAWVCRKEWKLNERGECILDLVFHFTTLWMISFMLPLILELSDYYYYHYSIRIIDTIALIFIWGYAYDLFEYGWEMALGAKR